MCQAQLTDCLDMASDKIQQISLLSKLTGCNMVLAKTAVKEIHCSQQIRQRINCAPVKTDKLKSSRIFDQNRYYC